MIQLTINQQPLKVPKGTTLLKAAQQLGLNVPTLCYSEDLEKHTSCMVCVVEEIHSGKLLPACTALAEDGMAIDTESSLVIKARQSALDLLISEHVGDCEGPCQLICPAHMNIPLMLRQIVSGQFQAAVRTVRERIAIPAILGRICPAPCENGCRRKEVDDPVSICLLKRFAADTDLSSSNPKIPEKKPRSGKRAVIVGAGPAGLSAAYYLILMGHECTLIDDQSSAGGQLQTAVPEEILPKSVLEAEIAWIMKLGLKFQSKTRLGEQITLQKLQDQYDAVILTLGEVEPEIVESMGLEGSQRGIKINADTFETSLTGVFAGGNAVHPGKLAVRSSGHGWSIAQSVDQFLKGVPVTGPVKRFQSRIGRIQESEIPEFQKEGTSDPRQNPSGGIETGFTEAEAIREASRCLHCDCRKPETCKLRDYSEIYKVNAQRFKGEERFSVEKVKQSEDVIYEPGKCIKCGICVRITAKAGEKLGVTFTGRGFNVKVVVPFNESLSAGLEKTAADCIEACPTGALALVNSEERNQ